MDCRPAAVGLAHQYWAVPAKMALPILLAGVKQRHDLAQHAAGQIRSLCQVATLTTPGEVGMIVFSRVLLGNDVFDVKGVRIVVLVDAAILAPEGGPHLDH